MKEPRRAQAEGLLLLSNYRSAFTTRPDGSSRPKYGRTLQNAARNFRGLLRPGRMTSRRSPTATAYRTAPRRSRRALAERRDDRRRCRPGLPLQARAPDAGEELAADFAGGRWTCRMRPRRWMTRLTGSRASSSRRRRRPRRVSTARSGRRTSTAFNNKYNCN